MFSSNYNGNGYSLSDIAAATRGNQNNGDIFGCNGGSWWILLLFIFMLFGWGGNRGNYGGDNGNSLLPFLLNNSGNNSNGSLAAAAEVQRGFDQSAVVNGINGIQSAINTGFSNAEVSRCNAQANLLQTLNNNQMGLYQTMNAGQVGVLQGFNGLQAQLAQCCCDNRAATQDVKYTIATENCQDRQAISNGVRDIVASNNAGFQQILDKLCQLELDNVKQNYENRIYTMQIQNDQLRADNVALRGDISQANQTALIEASQSAQTARIINAVNPTPIPAYVVSNPNSSCPCNNYNRYNSGYCGN